MKLNKISKYFIGASMLGMAAAPISASANGWPVTDFQLFYYLSGVATNGGNGVVELLTSLNSAIAQGNSVSKQNEQNKIIAENDIEYVKTQNDAIIKRKPDYAACSSASSASAGGGASVNTTSNGYSSTKKAAQTLEEPLKQSFKYEKALSDKQELGVCSTEDVRLKVAGCAAPGKYAGLDNNALAILYKPMTDSEEKQGNVPIGGLNKEEQAVRNNAIKVLVGVDAMDQLETPTQANTPEGAKYMYNLQQQNIRKSLAEGVMLKNVAIEAQMDENNANEMLKDFEWAQSSGDESPQEVWKNNFGDKAKFPELPSEWDILTYYVYSKYAATNDKSFQIRVANMDENELLKNMARMDAVNLRLQLLQAEYQKDTNKLLSTILAVMLENSNDQDKKLLSKQANIIVE